jgi:hypothetical protein
MLRALNTAVELIDSRALSRSPAASGTAKEARTTLRGAIRIADEVEATAVAERAEEKLLRAGGRVPSRHDSDNESGPSERRVAELAAAGQRTARSPTSCS